MGWDEMVSCVFFFFFLFSPGQVMFVVPLFFSCGECRVGTRELSLGSDMVDFVMERGEGWVRIGSGFLMGVDCWWVEEWRGKNWRWSVVLGLCNS